MKTAMTKAEFINDYKPNGIEDYPIEIGQNRLFKKRLDALLEQTAKEQREACTKCIPEPFFQRKILETPLVTNKTTDK